MLSKKTLEPLALLIAIGIVAMTAMAEGAEKKRRRFIQSFNDPYLAFVPGKPLLFAAEHGRSVVYLRYPELEVERKIEVAPDRKLESIKTSPDGTWVALFFEMSGFHTGGTLRVLKLATGETHLLLDDASRAFEFMDNNRVIAWQPKGGITQWELGEGEGKRVGPAVTSLGSVYRDSMVLSSDSRYVLIQGSCRGSDPNSRADWAYCLYDLNDGSTVGWSNARAAGYGAEGDFYPQDGEFTPEFTELLIGTNVKLATEPESICHKVGQNRNLCNNAAAVTFFETAVTTEAEKTTTTPTPPASAEAPKERPLGKPGLNFKDIVQELKERQKAANADAEAARARRADANKNGKNRILWTIRAGAEIGRFINSCALSADGRWVALASMGVNVSLFDTEQSEAKKNLLNGEWQEPIMVKQIELP